MNNSHLAIDKKSIKENKIAFLEIRPIDAIDLPDYGFMEGQIEFKGDKFRWLQSTYYDCNRNVLHSENKASNWQPYSSSTYIGRFKKEYNLYKPAVKSKNNKK